MNQYEIDYKQGYDKANDEWLERIDKIRAEIESKEMIETTSEHEFYNMALNDALQIIDKYKAEREDKK